MQQRLLVYLVYKETKDQADAIEADFKNQLFASNPDMYSRLYGDEYKDDEYEVEQIVPDSEESLRQMLRQLKSEGVIL